MLRYILVALFVTLAFAEEYNDEPDGEYGADHIDRGFTCRKAVLKDYKYIGFKDVVHDVNIGNNFFNKEYGFYRAEVGGVYHFSYTILSGSRTSTKTYTRVSLRINGKPQVWAMANRGYNMASNSATVFLKQGDVVYLYLEQGTIYEPKDSYRGFNTFNGFRLTYNEVEPIAPRTGNRRITKEEKNEIDNFSSKVKW